MAEKNPIGFRTYPSAPPPPYSTTATPPGYPMAPGQAQQAHSPQHHQQQQQGQNGQSPTVVIYANMANQFGPYPQRLSCPHCRAQVMTETRTKPGLLTYILSGTLLVLGWYLLCCLVPCCIRECQDIQHLCPNCKSKLGLYKRI